MNKRIKNIISITITLVLITLLTLYILDQKDNFIEVINIDARYSIILLLLALFSNITSAFYDKLVMMEFGIKLKTIHWLGIPSISNTLANFLPLRLDLVFKAHIYNTLGLSYASFTAITAGGIVLSFTLSVFLMIVSLIYCWFVLGIFPMLVWLFIGACVVMLVLFIYLVLYKKSLFLKMVPFKKYTLNTIERIIDGFILLLKNRRLLIKISTVLFVNAITNIFIFVIIFTMISTPESFFKVMLYTRISWFSEQFSLTPGNIGIKEYIMGIFTTYMDDAFNNGVLISLISRVTYFMSHFTLTLIFCFPVFSIYFKQKRIKK